MRRRGIATAAALMLLGVPAASPAQDAVALRDAPRADAASWTRLRHHLPGEGTARRRRTAPVSRETAVTAATAPSRSPAAA